MSTAKAEQIIENIVLGWISDAEAVLEVTKVKKDFPDVKLRAYSTVFKRLPADVTAGELKYKILPEIKHKLGIE